MTKITVNGHTHRYDSPLNVNELLQGLDLADKRLAVERNGEIVPRSQFANLVLENGDALEIVVAVGGG